MPENGHRRAFVAESVGDGDGMGFSTSRGVDGVVGTSEQLSAVVQIATSGLTRRSTDTALP